MATRGADEEPRETADRTPRKGSTSKASEPRHHNDSRNAAQPGELSASKAAGLAMRQVMELAGRDPESVTSLERTERGWRVGVEVVETRRIPDSADILAVYDTELDEEGELLSYRRSRRYSRGHSQE